MRHAVFTEVAATRFLDERQCPLPHSTQFRQHLFLLVDHLDVRRYRRLAPDHACFDDYHRNVKPSEKGHQFRGFLQELVGAAEDGPLGRAQVADQFASRPAPFGRPRFPLVFTDGIRGAQKFASRTSQVLDDRLNGWHGLINPCGKGSDGGPSGLLESMGQLEDARLSKGRSKDLQAHRQLSIDLSARYGDPWDSRQRSSNCIYISKIHLKRVVRALTQFERRNWRSRRQDRVHLCKRFPEILGNQRTNLLPLQIVGVVIARRKHVRAEHNAALYLPAKSRP